MDRTASWLTLISFGNEGWGEQLLRGTYLTVTISVSAYVVGLCFGLLGAISKLSRNKPANLLAEGYTTVIRSIPDILVIFLVYYTSSDAVRSLLNVTGVASDFQLNGFVAAALSLGVVQGGYTTEVLRGAILSVARGQSEAAYAVGLSRWQTFILVVLPQAAPLALPGLGNLWLVVLKESSLVSLIGFTELVLVGKMAAGATRHYLFFYLVVGAVFLILSSSSTMAIGYLESRFRSAERRG